MKVTAIIPTLNEEKYIEKCTESLLNQDLKLTEILVVDGGSSDKTIEIVKKLKKRSEKEGVVLEVVLMKKKGITRARDLGFRKAVGDVIMSCDADTIYPPDYLKTAISRLGGEYVGVTGRQKVENPKWFIKIESIFIYHVNILAFRLFKTIKQLRAYNVVFLKSAYLKTKGMDVDIYAVEDELGLARSLNFVGKIYYEPKLVPLTSSRRHNKGGILYYLFKTILIDYWGKYFATKYFKIKTVYGRVG